MMGVVMPVLKPAPLIESCVMLAAAVPTLVILTVSVTDVLSACVPNPKLLGVAVRLGEPDVGVGVGVGPATAAFMLPPPHPTAPKQVKTKMRERRKYLLATGFLRTTTPLAEDLRYELLGVT
jgi:hypothetical protein